MPLTRRPGTVSVQLGSGSHKRSRLGFKGCLIAQPLDERLASHRAAEPSGHSHTATLKRCRPVKVITGSVFLFSVWLVPRSSVSSANIK
jgi:hypothetical protein